MITPVRTVFSKDNEENLTGEDTREGIALVISVRLPDPQFEGQTKAKLGNPEIRGYVEQVFSEMFRTITWKKTWSMRRERSSVKATLVRARARIAASGPRAIRLFVRALLMA